jgi:L-lactate dehydrogenase (cytochrome)
VPDAGTPADFAAWIHDQIDASVTWADIAALRKDWPGRLVIKGVLDPEDARAAVDAGAEGVIVSNHGGRQLDGVASGIAALPGVVEAVGTRTAVLMDGGVRSGQDVLRAVALGAKGVLVGRPWVFAMAAGGPQRLRQWLATIQAELKVAMALTGVRTVAEIGPDCLDLSRHQAAVT